MKNKFELTAEEVEIVEQALKGLRTIIVDAYCMAPEVESSLRESRIIVDNILERIKEYKDGNK